MNNTHYKIAVFVLLTIVVGTFTHCVQNAPVGGSSTSGSSRSPSGGTAQTPEQVLNTAQVDVGLKNFEQINYSFAELTGVPVSNAQVSAAYTAVEATLPSENEVKVLQSSNQVAITRLAAEYCNQLVTNGTFSASRDAIFGTPVFTLAPNNAMLDKVAIVNRTTNAFWGAGIIPQAELDVARLELLNLFDDIVMMDATPNVAATTSKAVRAVCTAALSSAYVTIM
ncbi:MAG: hypothetical protein V4598_01620 [Bdellovibrionota bacterium]